jgi:hypothetical protein
MSGFDPIILLLVVLLVVEIAVAMGCAFWMRRRYGRRLVESYLWDRLVHAQIRIIVAGILIGVVAVYGLTRVPFDWPPIPPPWGAIAVAVGLYLLLWQPIEDWWTLRKIINGDKQDVT